jgi:hypothetical protein
MIVEDNFNYRIKTDANKTHVNQILNIYNNSRPVIILDRNSDYYDHTKYPYTGLSVPSPGIGRVEIRTNAEAANLFRGLQSISDRP